MRTCRARVIAANLLDGLYQSPFPLRLGLELLAAGDGAKFFDKVQPIDQQCVSRLITTEAMEQFDCLAPPQSEQPFHDGAVQNGNIEDFQLVDNFGDMQQPRWFDGHLEEDPVSSM